MSYNTILATAPLTTTNYILKATGTTIGNSLIWDNGTNVGIGNTNTSYTLDVSGSGSMINIIGASSGDIATGFRIGRGASLGAEIYDNPADNITTFNTTGGLNLRVGGSNRLTIASTGAATFSSTYGNVLFKGTNASTMWTEYYYNTSTLLGYIGGGSGILSGANASDFIVRSEADLVVATGNNRRMTITSGGIVTTPYQVSFKGYIISNVSIAKGSYVTIPYNGEEYDVQSNYSTSTYKFTAPVAGKYLFTVNFNAYSLDDAATLKVALVINSSSFRFLYGFANLPTGNTGDTNISGSDILNLSAGNTVEVRVLSDGSGTFNMSQDTTYNSFSGHLL